MEALWKQLDNHFGNKHYIIDAAIKAYFELESPEEDINKFEKFYIQSKNRGANLLDLDHDPEELLTAYFMLKIPSTYRSEIEQKLNNTKADREDETKYTFDDLNPLVEEFIRIKKMALNNTQRKVQIMVGITQQNIHNQSSQQMIQTGNTNQNMA